MLTLAKLGKQSINDKEKFPLLFFSPYSNDCWRFRSINKCVFVCICSELDTWDVWRGSAHWAYSLEFVPKHFKTHEMYDEAVRMNLLRSWNLSQTISRTRRCATRQCISNRPLFILFLTTLRPNRRVLKQLRKTREICSISLITLKHKRCPTRKYVKTHSTICP